MVGNVCVCVQIRKKESCERMVERTAREREREVHVDGEATLFISQIRSVFVVGYN